MLTKESLAQMLAKYALGRIPEDESTFMFSNATSINTFTTYVRLVCHGEKCIVSTVRDFRDDEFASRLFGFVAGQEQKLTENRPIVILAPFRDHDYHFDSVGVLDPMTGNRFEAINKTLNSVTFVVFPMFRCDFRGDETRTVIRDMMHETVCTVDWKRKPSCAARVVFVNTITGVRSPGNAPHVVGSRTLLRHLKDMEGADGSYIDLINVNDCRARIDVVNGLFNIGTSAPDQRVMEKMDHVPLRIARRWVGKFLEGRLQT